MLKSYSQFMGEQPAHLTLKLDTAEPVELGDFVGAFTSLANEFERYIEASHPGLSANPQMFLKEVRSGCIEADIITGIVVTAVAPAVQHMDQILILEDFVRRWGARLTALISNNIPEGELSTPAELRDFHDAVHSIASDPVASHRLEAATFEDRRRDVKVKFQFNAAEARSAMQNIEDRKRQISSPSAQPKKERVLMVFTRTDVHDAAINKRSGERVVIEELSPKHLSVMYASEMVEREIREHIRDADENVYKRGFVVDAIPQMSGNKLVAYSITEFHSVIDID